MSKSDNYFPIDNHIHTHIKFGDNFKLLFIVIIISTMTFCKQFSDMTSQILINSNFITILIFSFYEQ